jgi:type II secretory pathway pseudopilin PulG
MDTWEIVVLVVLGLLALLFVGGLLGNARMRREREASLARRIAEADHHLAEARAQDRGWDPELLEAAARAAFGARHPGLEPTSLDLIQVVDRPGTDEDRALMRVTHAAGEEEIELQRTGDRWDAS